MKPLAYGSLCTDFYDADKPEAPHDQLSWYRRFIDAGDEPVLAAMCGSGRFLVPLREAGIDIDGVDGSPDMLAACRAKLEQRGLSARIHEQRLQELDLPRRYGTAYVGGSGSFGLIIDREDAHTVLRRLHAHLEPGGRLCFEAQTPRMAPAGRIGRTYMRSVVRPDGMRLVLTAAAISYEDGVLEAIDLYQLFDGAKLVDTELEQLPLRLYEADEMRDMLESAGFADVRITKGFTDENVDGSEGLLSYRCVKP